MRGKGRVEAGVGGQETGLPALLFLAVDTGRHKGLEDIGQRLLTDSPESLHWPWASLQFVCWTWPLWLLPAETEGP